MNELYFQKKMEEVILTLDYVEDYPLKIKEILQQIAKDQREACANGILDCPWIPRYHNEIADYVRNVEIKEKK